jgi:ABC-type dipeptide/oligopeptide/nickel transport system permease subunit
MRVFEILNSIPFLMLAILIVAVFGSSIPMLIVVLSVFVLQPARIVRGQVLELREKEYAQAARALGAGQARVIVRHILPNVLPTLLVVMSVRVGQNILSLAGLSFLGMGITPPTPSWGSILQEGRAYILNAPWLGAFPGAAIFVTVLAFNLLGDGLHDALDPRLGRRTRTDRP